MKPHKRKFRTATVLGKTRSHDRQYNYGHRQFRAILFVRFISVFIRERHYMRRADPLTRWEPEQVDVTTSCS